MPLYADVVRTTVNIDIAGFSVDSHGTAKYEDYCSVPYACAEPSITGYHRINDGGAGTVVRKDFGPTSGAFYVTSYSDMVSAGTQYEHCYRAEIYATGSQGASQGAGSHRACAPAATTCVDFTCNPGSPVIISLRGDYALTSPADGVLFDLDANGVVERIAWTSPSRDIAFVARDRNGNGRIDDGSELFGDYTRLTNGLRAANGWEALAELDGNGDQIVNASDAAWQELLLWSDANHDGHSAADELVPLASSAITGIETQYRWTGRRDAFGNEYRYEARVTLANGKRPSYDVYLTMRQ
ncbi:MAG TPA: hypothetical protein VEK11_04645 [Thermoanaerobaculia bacterium]|nr:hypothetical protein [Thermoanaerobaculia bacterium]